MRTQSTSVTDGRTDGRTDRITITDTVQTASHGKNLKMEYTTVQHSKIIRQYSSQATKWLGLMADLKKLEQTTIDERIFIEIEVCVREGKVMATRSERGSSADVALRFLEEGDVGSGYMPDM